MPTIVTCDQQDQVNEVHQQAHERCSKSRAGTPVHQRDHLAVVIDIGRNMRGGGTVSLDVCVKQGSAVQQGTLHMTPKVPAYRGCDDHQDQHHQQHEAVHVVHLHDDNKARCAG